MTQPDTYLIELERKLTTVSLVVQLADDYAAGEPLGRISVSIAGAKAALKNPSGYYVFTDLPAATYQVLIEADFYLPKTVMVTTGNPADLVKKISLTPSGAYPFLTAATLIRGVVSGSGNGALPGAALQAVARLPDSSAKAKVGPAGASAGDTSMLLVNMVGQLAVGDRLMIKDSNAVRVEFCTISAPLPANPGLDPYDLVTPLKSNHVAGTAVHSLVADSVLDTRTTSQGEFVVYFSRTKTPRFITTVAISHANYQNYQQDVEVSEGTVVSLGRIQLIP